MTQDATTKTNNPQTIAPNSTLRPEQGRITGNVKREGRERWYEITHVEQMPGFLMTMASDSDHWLFLSSTGAMTAGRVNPDKALFPYYTQDKLEAMTGKSGGVSIIRLGDGRGQTRIWEPITSGTAWDPAIERQIRKNELGNHIVMEEVHLEHKLAYSVSWRPSGRFGFVRKVRLENTGEQTCRFQLMDGLRNILPPELGQRFVNEYSNLASAYQQAELDSDDGMALYHLSSVPTDLAEPQEALLASVAWQAGMDGAKTILTTTQIKEFEATGTVENEDYSRGREGAYMLVNEITLEPGESREWFICADVEQDALAVETLKAEVSADKDLPERIERDCRETEQRLYNMLAKADGIQCTGAQRRTLRHTSNTLFNLMRGGTFPTGYTFPKADLVQTIEHFNSEALADLSSLVQSDESLTARDIWEGDRLKSVDNPDLLRLLREYLPLSFSRRHGDPSRPWNRFSIEIKDSDGAPRYAYQGNWRDIFQNWEALVHSYPEYCEAAICRFLNATTADGYNPYRLTKDGYDWEVINPDDPWANIGYWGDHQIIYLLRLLEASVKFHPERLREQLTEATFVYAEVPYRIRSYEDILKDPRETVDYDHAWADRIADRVKKSGFDGRLARTKEGTILHVCLLEKLLSPLVAKLANFIPDGGIWMNTQRPEWNDANNALVGSGVSVVTLGYIARYLRFLTNTLGESIARESFELSGELAGLLSSQAQVFANEPAQCDDVVRRDFMDRLGQAASSYRNHLYDFGLAGRKTAVTGETILTYLNDALNHVNTSLRNNRRPDDLWHSYNLVKLGDGSAEISYLNVMLEGQVSILSSGLLEAEEAIALLDGLRNSELYREDQNSYILYPNRSMPKFLDKNRVPASEVNKISLLKDMVANGDTRFVTQLKSGDFAFNAAFHNSKDVDKAIQGITGIELSDTSRQAVLRLFENTFNHHAFTGRSGTFFAYEGLGSIYWHMVSKLALAVQEIYLEKRAAVEPQQAQALLLHYREIRDGLGVNKDPSLYGAFPTDAYSHTPAHAGAQQPGMTGQVKEDILSRLAELGLTIENGSICFSDNMLEESEYLDAPDELVLPTEQGQSVLELAAGELGFAFCGIPVVYLGTDGKPSIIVHHADGNETVLESLRVPRSLSNEIFCRNGKIVRLDVRFARG